EFLWRRQSSTIELSDPAPAKTLAALDIDNYIGNVVYNWGGPDAGVRPFVFGGLGATRYSPGPYGPQIPNGAILAPISSLTRLAWSLGGGVKAYPIRHVGVKGTVRWTPTSIKSDANGVLCDPFFQPCWVVPTIEYSNQLEFSGGIVIRLG